MSKIKRILAQLAVGISKVRLGHIASTMLLMPSNGMRLQR